jgi:dihydrofolate reductase
MKRLRYCVAMSLDGYIANQSGAFDWIEDDPEVDFGAFFSEFDTFIMGRKTFEVIQALGEHNPMIGRNVVVFSRTLQGSDASSDPGLLITADDPVAVTASLKAGDGKDIWLYGGGILFRELLRAGLVDRVEVAVIPVLLGGGIPMLASGDGLQRLRLTSSKVHRSGTVSLVYDVDNAAG